MRREVRWDGGGDEERVRHAVTDANEPFLNACKFSNLLSPYIQSILAGIKGICNKCNLQIFYTFFLQTKQLFRRFSRQNPIV